MRKSIRFALAVMAMLAGQAFAAPSLQDVVADAATKVDLYSHREPTVRVIQVAPVEVVLQFTLDAEGAVTAMKVVRSSVDDRDVGRNVANGVKAGLAKAALKDIAGTYQVPVTFGSQVNRDALAGMLGMNAWDQPVQR